MKRLLSVLTMALICTGGYAQQISGTSYIETAFNISQQRHEGTARSVAMGNAFTALGGDMGGVEINPAASGVYGYSEFSLTPSISGNICDSRYSGNSSSHDMTRFGMGSAGFITSISTGNQSGLLNWNLGIVVTKQNNLSSVCGMRGRVTGTSFLRDLSQDTDGILANEMDINNLQDPFASFGAANWASILAWNTTLISLLPDSNNQYTAATENLESAGIDPATGLPVVDIVIPGALNQEILTETRGNVTSTVINIGGNIEDRFFFGANLGIKSVYQLVETSIHESAENPGLFQTGFRGMGYWNENKTFGTGVDLKVGFIFAPIENFRFGAAVSTPTFYWLTERYSMGMQSSFTDGYNQRIYSPVGEYDYCLTTPFTANAGAAYVLPGVGTISADYQIIDYSTMRLRSTGLFHNEFTGENKDIKNIYDAQHIFRAGFEITALPFVSLRGGYQYYSNPYKGLYSKNGASRSIISAGIGFSHPSGFFIDGAFQKSINDETFVGKAYLSAPDVEYKQSGWKALLTVGFRF